MRISRKSTKETKIVFQEKEKRDGWVDRCNHYTKPGERILASEHPKQYRFIRRTVLETTIQVPLKKGDKYR